MDPSLIAAGMRQPSPCCSVISFYANRRIMHTES